MAADIALDSNWDLAFINGDLAEVAGGELTRQNSKFRLQIIAGEMFDDTRAGVPWLTDMVDPRVDIEAKKEILRRNIAASFGVISIDSLSIDVDGSEARCRFSGTCASGDFSDVLAIYSEVSESTSEVPEFGAQVQSVVNLGIVDETVNSSIVLYGTRTGQINIEQLSTGFSAEFVFSGGIVIYDQEGNVIVSGSNVVTLPDGMVYDNVVAYVYPLSPVPAASMPFSIVIAVPIDESAEAYFAAIEGEEGTMPDEGRWAINELYLSLKQQGIYSKLASLKLFANFDYVASYIDLVDLGNIGASESAYVDRVGYPTASGGQQCVYASYGGDGLPDDVFFAVGVADVSGDGHIAYGENDNGDVMAAIIKNGSTFDAGIQCAVSDIFDAANPIGRDIVLVRDGATSVRVYIDGVQVQTDNASSAVAASGPPVNLGGETAEGNADITATYLWSACGSALTAGEVAALKTIIDNYLAAL